MATVSLEGRICSGHRFPVSPGQLLCFERNSKEPRRLDLSNDDWIFLLNATDNFSAGLLGELCETALTTVSVPEMFRYWVQGGKIDVGFLGAAQIDKYANLNPTLIGDYTGGLANVPLPDQGRRLIVFLGGTLGNFEPADALAMLEQGEFARYYALSLR